MSQGQSVGLAKEEHEEQFETQRGDTQPMASEADLEDGELEDGELDDDEPVVPVQKTIVPEQPPTDERPNGGEYASGQRTEISPNRGSDEDGDDDDKGRRKDKKRKRKRRHHDEKDKHDKKKRKKKYHDHDNVNEYPGQDGGWKGYGSPPGPYDSPRGDSDPYEDYYGSPNKGGQRGGYQGGTSPQGQYDNPYESPPGPYDSPPSDEEDGPSRGKKRRKRQTLSDMIGGENYMDEMDAGVAANEQSDHFRQGQSSSKMRKREKSKRYWEKKREREQEAAERDDDGRGQSSHCRFFKDGKCSRGDDCQYSHDVYPEKKQEICKFYLNSHCSKGDRCIFMHGEFPCKFFHTGLPCYAAEKCKFKHEGLADGLEHVVERLKEEMEERDFEVPTKRKGLLGSGHGSPPRNQGGHGHQNTGELKKIPSLFDIEVRPPPPKRPPQPQGPPHGHHQLPPGGPPNHGPPGHGPPGHGPGLGGHHPPGPPVPRGPGGPGHGPPPGPGGPLPNMGMRPPFFGDMGGPGRPPMPPNIAHQPGLLGPPPPGMRPPGPGMLPPRMPPMGMPPMGPGGPGLYGAFYDGNPGNTEGPPADNLHNDLAKLIAVSQVMNKQNNSSPVDSGDNIAGKEENVPNHLPPKQQELFKRIQQQQRENQPTNKPPEFGDDDNWYSSDEDENKKASGNANQQGGNVMADIINSLGSQANPQQSPQQGFDIAKMINALRGQMSPSQSSSPQARDPRAQSGAGRGQPAADPRKQRPPDKPSPKVEETPEIDSYDTEDTFPWKLFVVEKRPLKLTDTVVNDPNLKDDPRLKKYRQKMGISSPSRASDMKKVDSLPIRGNQSPDSKLSRNVSAPPSTQPSGPTVSEKTGMPSLPPLPGLGTLLDNFHVPKPTDPRLSRQLSNQNSETKKGEISPPVKDFKPLSHRSDPRFRKKSKSTDTPSDKEDDSPVKLMKENDKPNLSTLDPRSRVSVQRRDNLDYSSPLGGGGSPGGNHSPVYSSYGRPSNNRSQNKTKTNNDSKKTAINKLLMQEVDSDKPTGSPGPMDPDMPVLTPILPEDIDADQTDSNTDERSLKDTFSTLDPTASPFC